jgi:phosphatidylglycerophosphatase A
MEVIFMKNVICEMISTVFNIGKVRFAPGTVASLVATLFGFIILEFCGRGALFFVSIILFIIGTYTSDIYAKIIKKDDPSDVVIDEVVGMFLSIAMCHHIYKCDNLQEKIISMLFTFGLFRFFDILKPFPISYYDKTIKGGFGIMFDDVLAAVYVFLTNLLMSYTWSLAIKDIKL